MPFVKKKLDENKLARGQGEYSEGSSFDYEDWNEMVGGIMYADDNSDFAIQRVGELEQIIVEEKAGTIVYANNIAKARVDILQTLGQDPNNTLSQKVVTDNFNLLYYNIVYSGTEWSFLYQQGIFLVNSILGGGQATINLAGMTKSWFILQNYNNGVNTKYITHDAYGVLGSPHYLISSTDVFAVTRLSSQAL